MSIEGLLLWLKPVWQYVWIRQRLVEVELLVFMERLDEALLVVVERLDEAYDFQDVGHGVLVRLECGRHGRLDWPL